jgi:hypothetical protein
MTLNRIKLSKTIQKQEQMLHNSLTMKKHIQKQSAWFRDRMGLHLSWVSGGEFGEGGNILYLEAYMNIISFWKLIEV